MEKTKRFFVNILFYCVLIASMGVAVSPIAFVIYNNLHTATLFMFAIPMLFLTFILSIIPFTEKKKGVLAGWQTKTINFIFMQIVLLLLVVILMSLLIAITHFAFKMRNIPFYLSPLPLFIASFAIGIVSKRNGWLYGLIAAIFYWFYMTAIACMIMEPRISIASFIGFLPFHYSFRSTIYSDIMTFAGGIAGGFLGSYLTSLILKWRQK